LPARSEYITKQKEYYKSKLNDGYSVIYLGCTIMCIETNFIKYLDISCESNFQIIKCVLSKYLVDDFAYPKNNLIPYKLVNIEILTKEIKYRTRLYYNIVAGKFESKASIFLL